MAAGGQEAVEQRARRRPVEEGHRRAQHARKHDRMEGARLPPPGYKRARGEVKPNAADARREDRGLGGAGFGWRRRHTARSAHSVRAIVCAAAKSCPTTPMATYTSRSSVCDSDVPPSSLAAANAVAPLGGSAGQRRIAVGAGTVVGACPLGEPDRVSDGEDGAGEGHEQQGHEHAARAKVAQVDGKVHGRDEPLTLYL
eukprot:1908383-Prymnesium_polylepis.1